MSNVLFANPISGLNFNSLTKADSQFLFKDNANVISLNKNELKSTEGKFWFYYLAIGSFAVARYATMNAATFGNTVNTINNGWHSFRSWWNRW